MIKYLSPSESIYGYVGPAVHKERWLPVPRYDSPLILQAVRELRAILAEKDVPAFRIRPDGIVVPLTPLDMRNEFFFIDIKRDGCFFGPIEGPLQQMWINMPKLLRVTYFDYNFRPKPATSKGGSSCE